MFPKALGVVTKHTPATPTALEQNSVIETRYYDSEEAAKAALPTRIDAARESWRVNVNGAGSSFGPGTPTFQGAIFVSAK